MAAMILMNVIKILALNTKHAQIFPDLSNAHVTMGLKNPAMIPQAMKVLDRVPVKT